jgi:hypothetical protein
LRNVGKKFGRLLSVELFEANSAEPGLARLHIALPSRMSPD